MTGKQLVLQLKAKVNNLDTASNRTLRPEMALLFLNDAYLKLTKSKYSKGVKDDTAFQAVQLLTDDLNHLTKVSLRTPIESSDRDNQFETSIAEIVGYWKHLKSEIKVKIDTIEKWKSNLNYKTLDTLGPALNDPFNKPSFNEPIIYFEDNKIKFPVTNYTIIKHVVSYLKKPDTINLVDEVLAPFTDEIVDRAAVMILENWGDKRTESKITVDKVIESE